MANNILYIYFAPMQDTKSTNRKPISTTTATLLLIAVYIILFEFSWLTQNIFPKPSILFESFISLWNDYNLLQAMFETTAIIFPVIFLALLFIELFIKILLSTINYFPKIANISTPFKYFSFFLFALVFNLLFNNSLISEFVFVFLFVIIKMLSVLILVSEKISMEYFHAAKSLGLSKGKILSKVVWKNIQPKFYSNLSSIHSQAWLVILVYEFIGGVVGIGSVYRLTYNFNDVFAIISLGIFISLLIMTVNVLIKIVISKIIFWN